MTKTIKAKMFLSDERGLQEDETHRSYHTFNMGNYFNAHKIPFYTLYVWNDETLAAGYSVKTTIEESSSIILLPVVGAIYYKDSRGNENMINPGEVQMIYLPKSESFELSNPYENELVNYLQIHLRSGAEASNVTPILSAFNLTENKNRLVELGNTSSYPKCSIGQFDGREEADYTMQGNQHGLFVFIIEGAFEVQGRLLHPRDGLALWDVEEAIELEALSNEAIVFLLEVERS